MTGNKVGIKRKVYIMKTTTLNTINTTIAAINNELIVVKNENKENLRHVYRKVNAIEAKLDWLIDAITKMNQAPVQEPTTRNNNKTQTSKQYDAVADALVPIAKTDKGEAVYGTCSCGYHITSPRVVAYCQVNGLEVTCKKCQDKKGIDAKGRGLSKENRTAKLVKVPVVTKKCACCGGTLSYKSEEDAAASFDRAKAKGLDGHFHGKCAAKLLAEKEANNPFAVKSAVKEVVEAAAEVVVEETTKEVVEEVVVEPTAETVVEDITAPAIKEEFAFDNIYYALDDVKDACEALGFGFRKNMAKAKKAACLEWLKENRKATTYINDNGVIVVGSYADICVHNKTVVLTDEEMEVLKAKMSRMRDVSNVGKAEPVVEEQVEEVVEVKEPAKAEESVQDEEPTQVSLDDFGSAQQWHRYTADGYAGGVAATDDGEVADTETQIF